MIMKIPKQFTIHGHTINIRVVEYAKGNQYGYYDNVREEILIARKVKAMECLLN